MADVKVSALPVLASGELDLAADFIMVGDASAGQSKRMAPGEMVRAAIPFLSSFYDFTTGALPAGIALTRASTGWRFNSSGVLVPETDNAARFQYDPVALTPRGLLVEGAATNVLQRNAELDHAYWTKGAATITADGAVAPDGTTSMDRLTENTAANQHLVRRNANDFVAGNTYLVEFFVKNDGTRTRHSCVFPSAAFGSVLRNIFDLSTGLVDTTAAGCTTFMQHVGNNVYRCCALAVATTTASAEVTFELVSSGGIISYTGDNTQGNYLWGLSLKEADAVTSHIPTTSAAVTRAADVALITNPLALADQCWIVKGRTPRKISGGAVNVAMQADDGSGNNRRSLRYGTDGRLHVIATVAGVDQCDLDLGAVANDTDFAVAIRWADARFAASLNGGAVVTETTAGRLNPLGLTAARIGRSSSGSAWNSTIRSIRHLPTALDAELPALAA